MTVEVLMIQAFFSNHTIYYRYIVTVVSAYMKNFTLMQMISPDFDSDINMNNVLSILIKSYFYFLPLLLKF